MGEHEPIATSTDKRYVCRDEGGRRAPMSRGPSRPMHITMPGMSANLVQAIKAIASADPVR